jgi:hypothetical protein
MLWGDSTLGPKLPQMMVHVKVGVAHALAPRHLTERCVRSELDLRNTELVKENAEFLQVGCKLGGWRASLVLVHFRPRHDSVRPMKREPKRHPFINRAFEESGGLSHPLFPKCCPKGIAQMTNHLMGGHASPTTLTLRTHTTQSVEHFFAVRQIEESFHFGKAKLHIQIAHGERILYHSLGLSPGKPNRLFAGTTLVPGFHIDDCGVNLENMERLLYDNVPEARRIQAGVAQKLVQAAVKIIASRFRRKQYCQNRRSKKTWERRISSFRPKITARSKMRRRNLGRRGPLSGESAENGRTLSQRPRRAV